MQIFSRDDTGTIIAREILADRGIHPFLSLLLIERKSKLLLGFYKEEPSIMRPTLSKINKCQLKFGYKFDKETA